MDENTWSEKRYEPRCNADHHLGSRQALGMGGVTGAQRSMMNGTGLGSARGTGIMESATRLSTPDRRRLATSTVELVSFPL